MLFSQALISGFVLATWAAQPLYSPEQEVAMARGFAALNMLESANVLSESKAASPVFGDGGSDDHPHYRRSVPGLDEFEEGTELEKRTMQADYDEEELEKRMYDDEEADYDLEKRAIAQDDEEDQLEKRAVNDLGEADIDLIPVATFLEMNNIRAKNDTDHTHSKKVRNG